MSGLRVISPSSSSWLIAPEQRHLLLLLREVYHATTLGQAPASPIFDNSAMLC
jgi:hypothetical protein